MKKFDKDEFWMILVVILLSAFVFVVPIFL